MLRKAVYGLFLFTLALSIARCGSEEAPLISRSQEPTPAPSIASDAVIKSTVSLVVNSGNGSLAALVAKPTQLPVTVVNAPNANMVVNTNDFSIPPISNQVLSFGKLTVTSLMDNDLRVCGATGNTKCTKAFIRIYTTGTAGPGLYNSAGGYGMPISAALASAPALTVGLGPTSAAVMQTVTIPSNKNVLRLADFGAAAVYQISSDFTEAGAGTYSTTLVIEYGLSL